MRSFIVRIYRHGRASGLCGTVQPVAQAAQPDAGALAFANGAELLAHLQGVAAPPAPALAPGAISCAPGGCAPAAPPASAPAADG